MLSLDSNTVIATNSDTVKTFFLYQIYYSDTDQPLRWTDWSDEVTFLGYAYDSKVIKHDEISESSDGKINDIGVTVGNVDRNMQYYLEHYDLMGKQVKIIQFFDGCTGYVETNFTIRTAVAKADAVSFSLSLGFDVLKAEVPGRILRARFCSWRFRDNSCRYAGSATSCDNTFESCSAKGNLANFGGFPGIINERFYF